MMRRFWFAALAALLAAGALGAQEGAPDRPVEPPRGFRSIQLGMDLEQVKSLLQRDPLFDYRGDPDVIMLPQPPQTLIECGGNGFLERAYFQFHEQRLYILILVLSADRLDYYTMFSTLSQKYGEPAELDPTEAIWDFPGLRVSLERPVSVKYIDTAVFAQLQEAGQAERDLWEISKGKFLEQF